LTYSGWLTHISGHPSATSRVQDSESTSAKDQCSTAGLRNQHDRLASLLNVGFPSVPLEFTQSHSPGL